jgi:hypothetical protein
MVVDFALMLGQEHAGKLGEADRLIGHSVEGALRIEALLAYVHVSGRQPDGVGMGGCLQCAIMESASIWEVPSRYSAYLSSCMETKPLAPASDWPYARKLSSAMAAAPGWSPNWERVLRLSSLSHPRGLGRRGK